jgi:ribosome biogenesis GTPase A
MRTFWNMVNDVISDADILLLVLDSRMAIGTRNLEIENKVASSGKPLIFVLNKCDLVDKHVVEQYKRTIPNSVFISARFHLGTTKLREKILMTAARLKLHSKVRVGVLGYPNVGKSSLINALKGKGAAKTSSISGYTKHIQKVRTSKIILLDTPGVIPYKERNDFKHNIIGTIDHSKEKDPDVVAVNLMYTFPGLIEKHYDVEVIKDKEETLVNIAKKRNMVRKGSKPDIIRASKMILKDWQTGDISENTSSKGSK